MAGIYIHFPFCKKKCSYCNFFSIASLKYRQLYFESLLKEIELQKDYLENEFIETVYFGGGTPSLMSDAEINMIFEKLSKYFKITADAEITIETNPDNLSFEYFQKLKNTPINRISIGVQSFIDEELEYLGRIHNAKKSLQSIEDALNAGFQNISIDLIYGIPVKQTIPSGWEKNLETIFNYNVPHISAYALTVEPRTILDYNIINKKVQPVSEDLFIEQYNFMIEKMKEQNYIQYEISNFCKKDFFSKHNTSYWQGKKYLGLGPSAHSFNIASRQWNVASITQYSQSLQLNCVPCEKEILSIEKKYNEYVLTSLRTMWGCDLNFISSNFGEKYYQLILQESQKYLESGDLIIKNNILFLTETGKLLADRITSSLFASE